MARIPAILVDEKGEWVKMLKPIWTPFNPDGPRLPYKIDFYIEDDVIFDPLTANEIADTRGDVISVKTTCVVINGVKHQCLKFRDEAQHKLILEKGRC